MSPITFVLLLVTGLAVPGLLANPPRDYYAPAAGLTDEGRIGRLCTLLDWHNRYGPTDFERRRNDRVFEIQGNRNPFIDEPGWANLIWGGNAAADGCSLSLTTLN